MKVTQENFSDPLMAQLLHGIDTLSRLVKNYHPLVKRYFLQVLHEQFISVPSFLVFISRHTVTVVHKYS